MYLYLHLYLYLYSGITVLLNFLSLVLAKKKKTCTISFFTILQLSKIGFAL